MWENPELDIEGTKPKHPDGNICLWKYQVNIQYWKSDCEFLINAKLLRRLSVNITRGKGFNYCPKCGKKMVKESYHG